MLDPNKEGRIPLDERAICIDLLGMFIIGDKKASELATEGQLEIFWCLVFRPSTRAQIICSTQYGKSLFVGLACIIISCIQEEVVAVVAPSTEKAKIIMRYFIDHLGDHPLFMEKLEANTKLDRLKLEESKDRIMLRNGGGIFTVSANTGNSKKTLEAAMGLGSKIVIGDEYCLIPDDTEATIFRMISGKGPDAFYCKIGNPFYRDEPYSHFYKTWISENKYYKIFIDHNVAVREGRYSAEFIEEAKEKPQFSILFECKFPDPGMMDADGYTPILTDTEIKQAQEEADDIPFAGTLLLGADCCEGKGQDSAANVKRGMNVAEVLFESNTVDEMQHAGQIVRDMDDNKIDPLNVAIDGNGPGAGIVSRIREQKKAVQGINTAEKAYDSKRFFNQRAEGFWRLRQWIKNGGKLKPHKRWMELRFVKYKVHSSGRIIIQSKDEMRKKGIPSPDTCDALMHTFLITPHTGAFSAEDIFFAKKMMKNKLKDIVRKTKRI